MAKPKQQNTSSAARKHRAQVQQQRQERLAAPTNRSGRTKNSRRVAQKRNPWLFIGGTVVVIAVIVGFFIVLSNQSTPKASTSNPTGTPVDATTLQQVTNVDPGLLSQIGTGGVANPFKLTQGSPAALIGPTGKPEVFYYGAEFCPLCAAERWGVVVALSRFGTFHNLHEMTSTSNDSYPNTSTFTFYQSSYTSQYIDFVAVEAEDQQSTPLQTPTANEQQLVTTYDGPPYIAAQYAGGFPFMDFGNRYLILGASYDPSVLRTDPTNANSTPLSQQQIASQLSTENSLSKNVLGVANYFTAAICSLSKNQPSNVCSDTAIQQIETSLSKLSLSGSPSARISLASVAAPFTMDVRRRQELLSSLR
jgi:hypothetical protein